MTITVEQKKELIKHFAKADNDTGSTEVQCSILSKRINMLTQHCNTHRKDFSSRRGLLKLVGQRRRLISYLKRESNERYTKLISALGLRK